MGDPGTGCPSFPDGEMQGRERTQLGSPATLGGVAPARSTLPERRRSSRPAHPALGSGVSLRGKLGFTRQPARKDLGRESHGRPANLPLHASCHESPKWMKAPQKSGGAGKGLLIGPESLRNGRGGGSGPESSVTKNPPGLKSLQKWLPPPPGKC